MVFSAIDLFCGCGGFSLGAHLAGLSTELAVDSDPLLSSAFARNFPSVNLSRADLSVTDPSVLEREFNIVKPTAIIGGPPCQGFSVMGRRNPDDPRNSLLERFFLYVAHFCPAFFLMENVPGLGDASNRRVLENAIKRLPDQYECLDPIVLNAADFGAATSRPRLIVLGYDRRHFNALDAEDFASFKGKAVSVHEAIWDLPIVHPGGSGDQWRPYPKNRKISTYAQRLRASPPPGLGDLAAEAKRREGYVSGCQTTRHSDGVIERYSKILNGERDEVSKYPRLDWERPAHVLRAGTGPDRGSYQAARPIHPDKPRVITVREAARIQGFPDWFQFHSTKWHSHRMIGNSVSPIFAQEIIGVVLSRIKKSRASIAAE